MFYVEVNNWKICSLRFEDIYTISFYDELLTVTKYEPTDFNYKNYNEYIRLINMNTIVYFQFLLDMNSYKLIQMFSEY